MVLLRGAAITRAGAGEPSAYRGSRRGNAVTRSFAEP
jgi:hypothetical protein